ncbi:hypothetical protein SNE40_000523 [Patella caerulea]|uniref:Uncharacterized protein n=1 Tax=Patella caerulea TaxID=87958 RepID=A0AAN8KJY8_PATCE
MAGVKHRLSSIWGEFLNETTLHGCKNTSAKQHGHVKRTLWFIFVGIMLGILVYTTCTFFMKYMEFNFVTRTSVAYHPELEFPAVTFCNLEAFDKNKLNKSNMGNFNKADPRVLEYIEQLRSASLNFSNLQDLRPNETEINKLGFEIDDIIRYGFLQNPKETILKSQFTVTYREPLEKCFTFNGRYLKKTYEHNPLKFHANRDMFLQVDTNKDRYPFQSNFFGVRLVLHHPDEPLNARSPSIILTPGYLHTITISEKRYKYLSRPYNSYQNQECVEVEKPNQGSGEYRSPYTYGGCIIKCLSNQTQSLCGCIIESLLHDNSSIFCTVAERHGCVLKILRSFRTSPNSEFCECKRPCFETKYDYELSSVPQTSNRALHNSDSNFYLRIAFKDTMVATIKHEPELDFGDIISHLGGYMGFCLGASVLTLIELAEVVMKSSKTIILPRRFTVNSPQIPPPIRSEKREIDNN